MYLNPLSMETKFEVIDIAIVKNFRNCLPVEFFNYINLDESFKTLDELNLNFGACYNITCGFLNDDINFELMEEYFKKYFIIYQISFSKLLPNFYLRNTKNGIKLCAFYELVFRKKK